MSLWLIVLILAIIAAVVGFGTAAHWLLIIGVVLLVIAAVGWLLGRRSSV